MGPLFFFGFKQQPIWVNGIFDIGVQTQRNGVEKFQLRFDFKWLITYRV